MFRMIALTLLISLPGLASAQQTTAPEAHGIFSWTDRPSVTARSDSLANPRSRNGRRQAKTNNPQAKTESEKDFEMGIEGYIWTGMVLKL
jgi:hypothetical protein